MTEQRGLLPDPHRDHRPGHRAEGVVAADPRQGRPRDHAHLRRPAGAAVHRGLDHPQLRVQPGRRRPDRQRVVERRQAGRAARRGRARSRGRTPYCRPRTTAGPAARRSSAMTDGRNAMLAVAMNGKALPIEHGFPVRTIVPGLYGYVSACKWVVDMEVTSFDEISAYWTERGWGEMGPVKMSSRVDVPRSGAECRSRRREVRRGRVGPAHRHRRRGVRGGRRRLGGRRGRRGADQRHLGAVGAARPTSSRATTPCGCARSTSNGTVQTGVERDVLPDGATGWHTSDFTAS